MDVLLDPDSGSLALVDGDFPLTTPGVQDIAQAILVTLQTHLGEYELDTTAGVPWRTQVLGKGRTEESVGLILRAVVERVAGVIRVDQVRVTIDRVTRMLSARLVVLVATPEGEQLIEIEGQTTQAPYLVWTNLTLGGY